MKGISPNTRELSILGIGIAIGFLVLLLTLWYFTPRPDAQKRAEQQKVESKS